MLQATAPPRRALACSVETRYKGRWFGTCGTYRSVSAYLCIAREARHRLFRGVALDG